MDKKEVLIKSITEANEAYRNSVIKILNEIVPGLDWDYYEDTATKICWTRHGQMSPDEIILMHDGRAFDNSALIDLLTERIRKTKIENEGLEPCIDKRYWCETCGSHSHQVHPETGYCFHCNTDNWEPENYREL